MKKIIVLYHSQEHGNTEALAKLVAQGAGQVEGVEVSLINTNEEQRVDVAALAAADGLAIGSPDYASYVAGTIKQVFDDMYIAGKEGISVQGKPCVLFMTHGGGGRGVTALKNLTQRLNVLAEPVVCRGAPQADNAEAIQLGRRLAQAVWRAD